VEEGLIEANQPAPQWESSHEICVDLLVVGGGAAGASAAVRAALWQIPTLLVEREESLFSLQVGVRTRWIDPTQYDWPAAHWTEGSCPPWQPPSLPLSWSASRSDRIAQEWLNTVERVRTIDSRYIRIETEAGYDSRQRIDFSSGRYPIVVPLYFRRDGASVSRTCRARMLVSARGFGIERTSIGPEFVGVDFWETDLIEEPMLGLTNAGNVLIVGGGDGALQDFLRALTGLRSAREFLDRILAVPGTRRILTDLEPIMRTADEQATRALLWGASKVHDCPVWRRWDSIYKDAVATLRASACWPDIIRTLDTIVAPSGRPRVKSVHLVFPCIHWTATYSLNRFIGWLLIAAYKERQGSPVEIVLLDHKKVASIECTGHSGTTWTACWGREHTGKVLESHCNPSTPPDALTSPLASRYEVIIVRSGLECPDSKWC
jgi:hypothetical protein